MEKILDRNIKELIEAFPPIADILAGYRIACTTCSVGTCRLKDIIEIHPLSTDDVQELFTRIAAVVYLGKSVAIPVIERSPQSAAKKNASPPIRILVDEHVKIMMVVNALPRLLEALDTTLSAKKETLYAVIDFIRQYADRFHHAKEEDLLFKLFDETSEIIAAMYTEHTAGRDHIRAAVQALDKGDNVVVKMHLDAYAALLTDHIRKEDEILYPWMDRQLTDAQVGNLFGKFGDVAAGFEDSIQRYVDFAASIGENG